MHNRKQNNRGGAMMEFTMLIPVWLPLLLGTLWIGSAMVRGQQVTQMARDLASMYGRGVNFSSAGGSTSSATLSEITQQLGTVSATGNGVVIFSTLTYVGNSVCASAGSAYGSLSPLSHTSACTNYGKFVFTQQYTQGNTNLRSGNFGTAPAADMDANFNIALATYITGASDVSTFNLLPAPQENGTDGYQSGQPAYVVEAFFLGLGQSGYTQGGNYAYAVF
jgi:energy-converting hydrogenase Eha subunit B